MIWVRPALLKGGEVKQRGERLVVHILAAHAETAQSGHLRKGDEAAAAEVGTYAGLFAAFDPELLQSPELGFGYYKPLDQSRYAWRDARP